MRMHRFAIDAVLAEVRSLAIADLAAIPGGLTQSSADTLDRGSDRAGNDEELNHRVDNWPA